MQTMPSVGPSTAQITRELVCWYLCLSFEKCATWELLLIILQWIVLLGLHDSSSIASRFSEACDGLQVTD